MFSGSVDMLAMFLHCHSNTETLNLTVFEFRRGGTYLWDKNTSARLCAKNAGGEGGGHICGTLRYLDCRCLFAIYLIRITC